MDYDYTKELAQIGRWLSRWPVILLFLAVDLFFVHRHWIQLHSHETPRVATSISQNTQIKPHRVVLQLSGTGNQITRPFTVAGPWQANFTFTCLDLFNHTFAIQAYRLGSTTPLDAGVSVYGGSGNGGTTVYQQIGAFQLDITNDCPWTLIVKST